MPTEVYGDGPDNADIMVVGEAPSTVEVRTGKPFQGPAGEQLDKILQMVGLERSELYVTNASLSPVTMTGGNKGKFFFPAKNTPSETYIRGMRRLSEDIMRIRPKVVVPLGNYALWAFMAHMGIMKWRGSVLWSDVFQVKVIPTIHPAALLRGQSEEDSGTKKGGGMWKMLTAVVHDLRRVKENSSYHEIRGRHRVVTINPEGSDLDEAIQILSSCQDLVFDMETFGGTNLACAGLSPGDPERVWVFECNTPERVGIVRALLEHPSTRKVGHNICGYDIPMLDTAGIRGEQIGWDTMIAQHTLTPDLPKSLAFLTSIYTDIPYYKDEGKILGKIRTRKDMEKAMLYCGKDVLSCAEIALAQVELLQERGLGPVFERRMAIFGPLRQAMNLGFRADVKKLYLYAKETERLLEIAQKELDTLAGWHVNVNSNNAEGDVKRLLYKERKIAPRYKDGKLSSDAHILADIAARNGDPAPGLIIRVRQLSKLLSNYYNIKILSPDGRIRTTYSITGTKSGRLSSSIPLWGPGVPIQTIPGKARSAFIADEGWSILEADQAQAEAVVVAYLANDPIHMDCFRTGKDVHRVTAALLTGLSIDEWQKIPKPSELRELAKTCNHELNYGAGPVMFMLTVNEKHDPEDPNSTKLTPSLAKVTWNRYHQIRPALNGYWETIRHELRTNSMTLTTPLGWEYTFLDKWSDSLLRLAYSLKPQSTVGEATNIGILQTFGLMSPPFDEPELYKAQEDVQKAKVKLLAQVHDSATFLVPTEAVEELGPKIMRLLEVPLVINGYHIVIPIEAAYGQTWYKGEMKPLGITRKTVEL